MNDKDVLLEVCQHLLSEKKLERKRERQQAIDEVIFLTKRDNMIQAVNVAARTTPLKEEDKSLAEELPAAEETPINKAASSKENTKILQAPVFSSGFSSLLTTESPSPSIAPKEDEKPKDTPAFAAGFSALLNTEEQVLTPKKETQKTSPITPKDSEETKKSVKNPCKEPSTDSSNRKTTKTNRRNFLDRVLTPLAQSIAKGETVSVNYTGDIHRFKKDCVKSFIKISQLEDKSKEYRLKYLSETYSKKSKEIHFNQTDLAKKYLAAISDKEKLGDEAKMDAVVIGLFMKEASKVYQSQLKKEEQVKKIIDTENSHTSQLPRTIKKENFTRDVLKKRQQGSKANMK